MVALRRQDSICFRSFTRGARAASDPRTAVIGWRQAETQYNGNRPRPRSIAPDNRQEQVGQTAKTVHKRRQMVSSHPRVIHEAVNDRWLLAVAGYLIPVVRR